MLREGVRAFCIVATCLATISCKKLEPTELKPSGPLVFEATRFANAIPDDYGTLIGVTQNPGSPAWVGLWFQRPDKAIAGVFVNIEDGRIYGKVLTIPRK